MQPSAAANAIATEHRVAEWTDVDARRLFEEIAPLYEPAILKGFVADWPSVQASNSSAETLCAYLAQFDRRVPIQAFVGPPEIEGRFFYRQGMDGFNFDVVNTHFPGLLGKLLDVERKREGLTIYMGSTPTAQLLPGFESENPMPVLAGRDAEPRIWVGNRTRVSAHYDESDNIACVVSGRRRFTLFPPDQIGNLYVGPIERTVAGRPISMVDLRNPDFERFPKFREALKTARVAALEPGDAIYIPSPWWHNVEAEGGLNILVNYWWQDSPTDAGSPIHALAHGLLTVSQLPERQREAWRAFFDHYVFRPDGDPADHIPEPGRGILGKSTPQLRRSIKQFLMQALKKL